MTEQEYKKAKTKKTELEGKIAKSNKDLSICTNRVSMLKKLRDNCMGYIVDANNITNNKIMWYVNNCENCISMELVYNDLVNMSGTNQQNLLSDELDDLILIATKIETDIIKNIEVYNRDLYVTKNSITLYENSHK